MSQSDMPVCAVPMLEPCALTRIGKDIADKCSQRVAMTMINLSLYTKERQYGTRINYVAVRSSTGRDRAVVPVPCYLISLCRIGCVSRAAVRRMRLLSS